ncbi:mediator complex subunit [Tulasnella sp. 419]|nr:mediator complex subunit [Tulasnella sp. 419]
MTFSAGADTLGVMPLGPHVNGFSGVKKVAATAADIEPTVVDAGYEDNNNDGYLDGYTMEDIMHGRKLTDPYMQRILPPYAHIVPLKLDSFRTGHQPTPDELYSELSMTFDGQVPLAEIIDKVVQDSYINLSELAEVMPSFSDKERKIRIIQYAQSTRKQIIKLYAIAKWARVAEDVQKAMDVLTFLARSEHHVEVAGHMIEAAAATMVMLKRRNADLLNAIDVLTTGTYRRLPSILQVDQI